MQEAPQLFPDYQVPDDHSVHTARALMAALGSATSLATVVTEHRVLGQRWNGAPDLPFPRQGGSDRGRATWLRGDSFRSSFLVVPLKKNMVTSAWIGELSYEGHTAPISVAYTTECALHSCSPLPASQLGPAPADPSPGALLGECPSPGSARFPRKGHTSFLLSRHRSNEPHSHV